MEELAIILPAFNEEKTVEATIREFVAVAPEALIVVVDNASNDNTAVNAKNAFSHTGCRGLLIEETAKGKGNALRKALLNVDAKIYVMADADCTYPAAQLHELLEPIRKGNADMVVGDRISQGQYKKINTRAFHNIGNNLISYLINILFNTKLNDVLSGYRAVTNSFVQDLFIKSSGFEIEVEITLHALAKKLVICEIPIEYRRRPSGSDSKLSTFKDGFVVVSYILYRSLSFSARRRA